MKILEALLEGKGVPRYSSLHHDLLWLPDAVGHAAAIASDLDAVEKRLMDKSMEFERHFKQFYLKAIELTGYMRTLRPHYPVLSKFHKDVNLDMYREECYYLLKLSESGEVPPPNCNPAKPRIESS